MWNVFIFLEQIPRSRNARSSGRCRFNIIRNCQTFAQRGCAIFYACAASNAGEFRLLRILSRSSCHVKISLSLAELRGPPVTGPKLCLWTPVTNIRGKDKVEKIKLYSIILHTKKCYIKCVCISEYGECW